VAARHLPEAAYLARSRNRTVVAKPELQHAVLQLRTIKLSE
jgi:hypothetical protein